jgi:hypothetical protein
MAWQTKNKIPFQTKATVAWKTQNKPDWWGHLAKALWDDMTATWDSLTIVWDAADGNWKDKNKPTWYTKN